MLTYSHLLPGPGVSSQSEHTKEEDAENQAALGPHSCTRRFLSFALITIRLEPLKYLCSWSITSFHEFI